MKRAILCLFLILSCITFFASIGWAQERQDKGPLTIKIKQGELTFWTYMHLWYAYFQQDSSVGSGGFVYPANEPGGFEVRRVRLLLDGSINPSITFRIHYEIAGTSSNRLKDAFVKFKLPTAETNNMNITVGQWKIPFSEATVKWLTPNDEFIRGPIILEPVGGTGQLIDRDLGAMFDSKFWKNRMYTAIGVFNGTEYNQKDDNNNKDIFAHATFAPLAAIKSAPTLEFGISGTYGTEGPKGSAYNRTRYAGRIKYLKSFESGNELMIRTEYFYKKMDGRDALIVLGVEEAQITDLYVAATYKIGGTYEIISRYDLYDGSDLDPVYGERTGYTLGFNWYANKNIRLMTDLSMYNEDRNKFDNNEALVQLEFKF